MRVGYLGGGFQEIAFGESEAVQKGLETYLQLIKMLKNIKRVKKKKISQSMFDGKNDGLTLYPILLFAIPFQNINFILITGYLINTPIM